MRMRNLVAPLLGTAALLAPVSLFAQQPSATVSSEQKDGVLLEMEEATALVAWKRIHPADRYRLRRSVIGEEDAAALRPAARLKGREAVFAILTGVLAAGIGMAMGAVIGVVGYHLWERLLDSEPGGNVE